MSEDAFEPVTNFISPRKDLYEVFSHPELSIRQRKKIIEALEDVDGFDITFIISLILNIKLMGHLNIVNHANEVSGVTFGNGFITHIDLPDEKTYIGQLLLDEEMIQKVDLDAALRQNEVQVGQYFLDRKLVSEQQISDLIARQMRLRLSKLICSTTFRINFTESAEAVSPVHISLEDYYTICHDWIAGRFDDSWLNIHFLPWESEEITFLNNNPLQDLIFQLPMLNQVPDLLSELRKSTSIKKLKVKYHTSRAILLKVIYFLSISSVINFNSDSKLRDKKINRLEAIFLELKNKKDADLPKILSGITKINENNTEAIYLAFMKIIEDGASENEFEFKNELIKVGLRFLSYKRPIKESENKGIASRNQISAQITTKATAAIQQDLLLGNYYDAMGKLKKLYGADDIVPSIKLYTIWAKVGYALRSNIKINFRAYESELVQVLPEDKETAEFFYVTAMLAKINNDKVGCQEFYKLAVKKKITFAKYPISDGNLLHKILRLIGIMK